ncbi:MAG: HAD-IA family hydrolase, partial [Candidatus Omnitrophica bacterium]|nr:HAD-IA family hydrolase [Candidatus Omnitrophota bacterium]
PSVWRHIGGGIRSLLGGILKTEDGVVIKKAVECFREYYLAHCLDKTVLYPGVTEVLAHYQGRKKRMAVVTNKDQEFTHKILAGLGVEKYFQSRIGVREGDKKKPHPDLLHKALRELESDSSETVIIGDSPADIEAGQKAGTKTCGVGYGIGEPEKIRSARPDFWVENPVELIGLF